MRALRVVGLSEDGKSVICEDPARSERFTVPADERLRAAARGDVTRLGQIEIELESLMRPREIQARIRAGESVEQVAAAAGVPAHRVERYAYPVLLERSRTAELAQRAHPVREDGPDVQTLAEVAAHAFGLRGQDYATAAWDSWRGEDGKWVVQLRWETGRSDNRAHWAFHPGAHGGTVIPLDDHANDLMDPNAANRPLRTVRPVTELARQALEMQPEPEVEEVVEAAAPPPRAERIDRVERVERVERIDDEPEAPVAEEAAPRPAPRAPRPPSRPAPEERVEERPVERRPPERKPAGRPAMPGIPPLAKPAAKVPVREDEPVEEPEPVAEPAAQAEPSAEEAATARKTEPAGKRGKKNHPIVPSWEDVLLGVRTQRG